MFRRLRIIVPTHQFHHHQFHHHHHCSLSINRRFFGTSSNHTNSPTITKELSNIFSLSPTSQCIAKLPIRDLAGKLSDDAFEELGETSLKDWISENMKSDLDVVPDSSGLFWVQRKESREETSSPSLSSLTTVINASATRSSRSRGGLELTTSILDAPPPPPPTSKKKKQILNSINDPLDVQLSGDVELNAVPRPDLWEEAANNKDSTMKPSSAADISSSSTISVGDVLRQSSLQRQEAQVRERLAAFQREVDRVSVAKRMLFCLPNFVVPLCHETMDILEEQISRMIPETDQYFKSGQMRNDDQRDGKVRDSPLKRFASIYGGSKLFKQDPFFERIFSRTTRQDNTTNVDGVDDYDASILAMAAELVPLDSFAPTKQQIEKWIEEEKQKTENGQITRVDNLIPENIQFRGCARNTDPQARNATREEIENPPAQVVVTSTALAPDFELPNWISEHCAETGEEILIDQNSSSSTNNGKKKMRYFFRLSPILHENKAEAASKFYLKQKQAEKYEEIMKKSNQKTSSEQDQDNNNNKNRKDQEEEEESSSSVNPFFNDGVFTSENYQVFEYDAFRLARCLPPSGSSISLKSLVIGGVLNVLSVPDVQFVITSFPEMFEYPVKFDDPLNNNTTILSLLLDGAENQAVRFILAGVYDKPPKRSPEEIRAEIESLGNIRKSKIDPKTGQQLRGGQWMRLFDKTNKLNKELALASNPGAHPLKDPRVLAQLLFDMLPLDEVVDLSTLHRRLKFTAVQLGDNLDLAFFRRFPHLFKVVEMGSAERNGVVRADATVDEVIMNPKPGTEEMMWKDLLQCYRRLVKNRESIAFSLAVVKVPSSSRLKMEELCFDLVRNNPEKLAERKASFQKRLTNMAAVFLDEIAVPLGVFEVVSRQGGEIFVRLRAENEIVQKYF